MEARIKKLNEYILKMKKIKLFLIGLWWLVSMKKVYFLTDNFATKFIEKNKENLAMMNEYYRNGNCDILYVLVKYFSKGRDRNGNMIMCMTMPSGDEKIIACLNPPDAHGEIIIWATGIHDALIGNPWVVTPPLDITALATLISTLTGKKGDAWTAAYNDLIAALEIILAAFQKKMNLDKPHAKIICNSGNFHVHGVGGNTAAVWGIENGTTGQLIITAETGPDNSCHAWWTSPDNIVWTMVLPTHHGVKVINGLTPGVLMHVKHELILVTGPTNVFQTGEKMVI